MEKRKIRERDQPITSDGLDVCQRILEAAKVEFGIADDDEEISRTATITIELYREGIHTFDNLKALVFAARGRF